LYVDLENLIQKTHSNFFEKHKEIYDDITVETTFAELVSTILKLYGDKEYELKFGDEGVVIEVGEYFNIDISKKKSGLVLKFKKQV
jgi:hypothetical protein